LVGSASDDGLPAGNTMTTTWTVSAGDAASVQWGDTSSPTTTVTFSAEGVFTLRLSADDGDQQVFDEVTATVAAQQSITLESPLGAEQWPVGSTQLIQWSTSSVDDVMILFSADDGATWETLASTVDVSSPDWRSFPWVVPDTPTDLARITVDAYLRGNVTPPTSAPFSIVASSGNGAAGGGGGSNAPTLHTSIVGGCACRSSDRSASGLWTVLGLYVLGRRRSR